MGAAFRDPGLPVRFVGRLRWQMLPPLTTYRLRNEPRHVVPSFCAAFNHLWPVHVWRHVVVVVDLKEKQRWDKENSRNQMLRS